MLKNCRARTKPEIRMVKLKDHLKFVDKYYSTLSVDERSRADRFTIKNVRERFIVSRALLRTLIAKKIGIKTNAIVFAYGPHGKPQLDAVMTGISLIEPFHFNVSHSKSMVLFCFGLLPVGADIEFVRKLNNPDRIAQRIISKRKLKIFRSLPLKMRHEVLLQIWTRKESIVKALGCGLTIPVKNFEVWTGSKADPLSFARRVEIPDERFGDLIIESLALKLPKTYVGAVSFICGNKQKDNP